MLRPLQRESNNLFFFRGQRVWRFTIL
ncbi:hemopexin repeat-containing protein [Paenibacillus sp. NPDC058177]